MSVTTEPTGEIVLGCGGELHLQICLTDLKLFLPKSMEIIVSDPIVIFRETVTHTSSKICVATSANRENKVFMTAEPLPEEIYSGN